MYVNQYGPSLLMDEVFVTLWYPWIQHTVPQDPLMLKSKKYHTLDFNSKFLIRLILYFTYC